MANSLLVTGAAGFIGSAFVRHWCRTYPEDTVIAYDALTYAGTLSNLAEVKDEIIFVQGDIQDQELVSRLLKEHRITTVVNFAAESHNSYAILNPMKFFSSNVMGPVALLEAVRNNGSGDIRFHQISTCEVYGDMELDSEDAFTPESAYRPRTPYNAAKAGGDHAVRVYGMTYGIPVTITNCSNNYGPYQFPEKVIPLFVTNALRGKKLPVYESSRNRREWLHVEDHCRAIDLVLRRGRIGETYHVGSAVEADVDQLVEVVLNELGLDRDIIQVVPDRPSHDRRYLLDSSKIRRELGWEPLVAFDKGLRETINWYRDNPQWWEPLLGRSPVSEEIAWLR